MSTQLKLGLKPSHTVVFVHDIDEMVRFYTDVLGFDVTDHGPVGPDQVVFLSQGVSHHQIAFVSGRETIGKSNTIDHTAYLSDGTLDDLKALYRILVADDRIHDIKTVTHGNTWSVYFDDPEGNGIEVYIETPWHVGQPQIRDLDLTLPNEEIVASTRAAFADERGFSDAAEFRRRRTDHTGQTE